MIDGVTVPVVTAAQRAAVPEAWVAKLHRARAAAGRTKCLHPLARHPVAHLSRNLDNPPVKPVYWLGDSRKAVQRFPPEARRAAGWQSYFVQQGCDPNDWKPMPAIGPGVREIRVHAGGEYRVI
jgi:hypothetical protein